MQATELPVGCKCREARSCKHAVDVQPYVQCSLARFYKFTSRVHVVRVGLKDLAIEVKPSDSRSKAFVAEHGTSCWEADVLPAAVIEKTINDEIRSWLDQEKWNQRDREIERARGLL